jgi:hypothetical protein
MQHPLMYRIFSEMFASTMRQSGQPVGVGLGSNSKRFNLGEIGFQSIFAGRNYVAVTTESVWLHSRKFETNEIQDPHSQ